MMQAPDSDTAAFLGCHGKGDEARVRGGVGGGVWQVPGGLCTVHISGGRCGRYMVDGVQYTVQYTIYNMGVAQYTPVGGGVQQVHGGLCTLYSSRGRTTLGTW